MNQYDRQRVAAFRNEYSAYLNGWREEDRIRQKIREIENTLAAHSPALESTGKGNRTHDEKLADYITRKQRLEQDLQGYEYRRERVEKVISLMPQDTAAVMRAIYSHRYTFAEAANRVHTSERGLRNQINREILKALNRY